MNDFKEFMILVGAVFCGVILVVLVRYLVRLVKQWLYNRRKKLVPVELFSSIRKMWQENWEQLNETGDFRWLFVREEDWARVGEVDPDRIREAFYKLHDEFTEATGVIEKMGKWRTLMVMRMEARAKVANGDISQRNWVNNYTAQIDEIMKTPDEGAIDPVEYRAAIQMGYRLHIDPRKTTVYEFLKIANLVKTMNKPKKDKADAERN